LSGGDSRNDIRYRPGNQNRVVEVNISGRFGLNSPYKFKNHLRYSVGAFSPAPDQTSIVQVFCGHPGEGRRNFEKQKS